MNKDEHFKLLKIQTCDLKVNIHCDGCKQKVKKLLLRIEVCWSHGKEIEWVDGTLRKQNPLLNISLTVDDLCSVRKKENGVYTVNIDAEQQKVTVSGSVDSGTLIEKLVRAGKHTELWSQKSNQNQKQKITCIKDDKNNKGQKQVLIKGLDAFKTQKKFPVFISDEDDDDWDDEEEDCEEEDIRFLREKASQLSLLRQQALDASNAKKGFGAIAPPNNGKINNSVGNGNVQKNANPNQNVGLKVSNPSGGIEQKTMAALKMSNPHLVGGGNVNPVEVKRGNDVNSMMGGVGGFLGNNGGSIVSPATSAFGGNSNGLGGFQIQPNGYQGSSAGFPNTGFSTGHQHASPMLMNLNGNQYNHPSQMMMNMNMQQNRHGLQQPQMMYHMSPFVPPSTGYYYNYTPYPAPYTHCDTNYCSDHHSASASHIFSDENTSGCSIM